MPSTAARYLELCKPVLNSEETPDAAKRGTRHTLVQVLESLLRIAHPIMPFITEEIWQQVAPLAGVKGETIMLQPYPEKDPGLVEQEAVREMNWVMQFILGIRKIKGEMNIPPGKPVPVLLSNANQQDQTWLASNRHYLDFLARTETIRVLGAGADAPESATALVGEMEVLIPLADLIDKAAELARLDKETGKLHAEIERAEKKLSNPGFVDKAPAAVVQKERDKLDDNRSALARLSQQADKIRNM